jgi:hypothetical protein
MHNKSECTTVAYLQCASYYFVLLKKMIEGSGGT